MADIELDYRRNCRHRADGIEVQAVAGVALETQCFRTGSRRGGTARQEPQQDRRPSLGEQPFMAPTEPAGR